MEKERQAPQQSAARAPDISAANTPEEDVALEIHEYANIFPELSDDRLAELAQDIREQGLLDKIDCMTGRSSMAADAIGRAVWQASSPSTKILRAPTR